MAVSEMRDATPRESKPNTASQMIRSQTQRKIFLPQAGPRNPFDEFAAAQMKESPLLVGYPKISSGICSTYDGRMLDIAEDSAGNLWIADQQGGLLHLRGGKLVERIPWASLRQKDFALSLAADHLRGGIWLGFSRGGISHFADGHIQETYAAADGLGNGSVTNLQVEKDGTLWAATDGGLSRMKNGRFVTLARENGLPCHPI